MKKGIGVLAFDRPKHLYVALDSIYKMSGINDWLVGVYFDGPHTSELRQECSSVLGNFPVDKVVFSRYNLGILEVTFRLLRGLFYKEGCEEILFMAEDLIIRSDTLEFLDSFIQGDAFVYQLCHHSFQPPGEITWSTHFNQCGFVIFRDSFVMLDNWIRAGMHMRLYFDSVGSRLNQTVRGIRNDCDHIIQGFMEAYSALCKFPEISYVAHTGLVGMNSYNSEACKSLEVDVFSKPRDLWLPSFSKLWPYTSGTYDDTVEYMLIPNHFVYI